MVNEFFCIFAAFDESGILLDYYLVYFNVIIYMLPAQGIGQVKTGQDVKVRLDNYPDREFGYLTGKVHDVAYIPDDNGLYQVNIFS